jgi:hypothetical protein
MVHLRRVRVETAIAQQTRLEKDTVRRPTPPVSNVHFLDQRTRNAHKDGLTVAAER